MTYENIGIIPDDFENKQRKIIPCGLVPNLKLITEPNLVLKLYHMIKFGGESDKGLVDGCRDFLDKRIKGGDIESYIGMGFAILSEKILNIIRWDDKIPIIMHNDVYEFKKGNFKNTKLVDIVKEGAYCMWENLLGSYEAKAWRNYLGSHRKEPDRTRYFENVFRGPL